jgi:hypothetical protein
MGLEETKKERRRYFGVLREKEGGERREGGGKGREEKGESEGKGGGGRRKGRRREGCRALETRGGALLIFSATKGKLLNWVIRRHEEGIGREKVGGWREGRGRA